MPHYQPPAGEAHGLIIATLKPNADGDQAKDAVKNLPRQQVMEIATTSYLKKDQPNNKPVATGDVVGAFVNSFSQEPIQSAQAHADMDAFVNQIRAMPFFTADVKHW
jgi:hypothetical protein